MNQTTITKDCLIPVTISDGMFASEYSIELKLADGTLVSFFADKNLVVNKNNEWFLKTAFVDQRGQNTLVLLPVEPFETQSRWAEVKNAA